MSEIAIAPSTVEKVVHFYREKQIQREIHKDHVPNFWSIIEYGQKSYETRYSRMLRWLIDPTENHQLKDKFLQALLKEIGVEEAPKFKLRKTTTDTEKLANIDVLFVSEEPRLTLTIEAKHFSGEHASTGYDSQLEKYFDAVNNQYLDYENLFVYLTVQGEDPLLTDENKDKEYLQCYKTLSFEQLAEILKWVEQRADSLDVVKIIRDFRWEVRKTLERVNFNVRDLVEQYGFKPLRDELDGLSKYLEGEQEERNETIEHSLPRDIQTRFLVETIRIIKENISVQDHSKSPEAHLLAQTILKELTGDDSSTEFIPITHSAFEVFDKREARLAQRTGQGVYLHLADEQFAYELYLSAGKNKQKTKIIFPNDGIHVNVFRFQDDTRDRSTAIHLNPATKDHRYSIKALQKVYAKETLQDVEATVASGGAEAFAKNLVNKLVNLIQESTEKYA